MIRTIENKSNYRFSAKLLTPGFIERFTNFFKSFEFMDNEGLSVVLYSALRDLADSSIVEKFYGSIKFKESEDCVISCTICEESNDAWITVVLSGWKLSTGIGNKAEAIAKKINSYIERLFEDDSMQPMSLSCFPKATRIPINALTLMLGDEVYEACEVKNKVYKHTVSRIEDRKDCTVVYWTDGKSNKDYGYLGIDTFIVRSSALEKLARVRKSRKKKKVTPRYTIPHCKHCKYSTVNKGCTLLMSQYGYKAMKWKPQSKNCTKFCPKPEFEPYYGDLKK